MKEYWRLLEVGEVIQNGDEWWSCVPGNPGWKPALVYQVFEGGIYRRRITVPDWPAPIAFADEKPKEGQRILWWHPAIKYWYSCASASNSISTIATHWLPAPPDVPEPKPAWEVAWEDWDKDPTTPWNTGKDVFKRIWDRAQKEKA